METLKSQTSKLELGGQEDTVVVKALKALSLFKEVSSFFTSRHLPLWDSRFPTLKDLASKYYRLKDLSIF